MFIFQKTCLILLLFTFVTYTHQQILDPAYTQKLTKFREECGAEQGIDLAAVKKAWDDNVFPNDNKLKCFYKCLTVKLGIVDATGEVVDDALGNVAAQYNNAATKAEIVEECGPIKGADLCETAYKLIVCMKAAVLD